MNLRIIRRVIFSAIVIIASGVFLNQQAYSCTRALYVGDDGLIITGRAQDWYEELQTDLWVFPRGSVCTCCIWLSQITEIRLTDPVFPWVHGHNTYLIIMRQLQRLLKI
jgi:hypothetical protein